MRLWALLFAVAAGCRAPAGIPTRASETIEHPARDAQDAREERRALLWTSYQIVVEAVDGEPTAYRATEPCVYYPISLPPGTHLLALRLDYDSPTHHVRTELSVETEVHLDAGASYRLLDLCAPDRRGRRFQPWLLAGPPGDDVLELR